MEGELKAEGREADVTCLSKLIPLPPPCITGGDFSAACTHPSPFHPARMAYDVIFDNPRPLSVHPLNSHSHEVPRGDQAEQLSPLRFFD
jgi:hypothetical protein